MTYEEIFEKSKEMIMQADVSNFDNHLAIQVDITGEGEGAFYIELKDRELHVEPYEYYDRDAMFVGTAELFTAIMTGKKDPVHEFLCLRLKVEGNFDKALKLKELIARNR